MNNETTITLDLPQWDRQTIAGGFELRDVTSFLQKVKLDLYYQNLKKDFYNNIYVHNWQGAAIVDVSTDVHTLNDQNSFGGVLQTDWSLGDHHLIVGADFNRDDLDALDDRPGGYSLIKMGNMVMQTPIAASAYSYRAVQDNLGVFAQDEWTISDDLTATLGIRETWVTSELKDNGNNPNLPPGRKISDSKPVGNVGLVYSGFGSVSLRALWSQGYRFPPLNALYFGTVHGSSSATLPNPDLEPETSNSYELGVRFDDGGLSFDIGIFANQAKNYITTQPIEGGNNQYVNADQAQTIGLELGLAYNIPSTGLTPYTTATFLRRKITNTITASRRNGTSSQVTYSTYDVGQPSLWGRVGIKYEKDFENSFVFLSDVYMDWAVKSQEYYYDSSFIHDFNGTGVQSTFDYGFVTDEYPAWTTLNLSLGLKWGTNHRWNATLGLRNIFDREYRIATNTIVESGFHIVAGIGFEF
jgi:hemoglobin/transferrin/lactoferrin receptor protein